MRYNFFLAFFLVILGVTLELAIGNETGAWLNFALAALTVAAFFTNFLELLALDIFVIFVFNWQPVISYELLILAALPLMVYFARKIFPFFPWLTNLISIAFAILAFYMITSPSLFFMKPGIIFIDLLFALFFSVILFKCFKNSVS